MAKFISTFEDFIGGSANILPTEIDIKKINKIAKDHDKVWVLTGGAPGSGKSYIVNKFIKKLPVVDMDIHVEKLSGGKGKYDSNLGSKARVRARKESDNYFATDKSFVKQGVSAGFNAVKNQCLQAKNEGYICIFLYVNTSIEQSKQNNKKRVESGERESSVPDYALERKWKDSQQVLKTVKTTPNLFNFYVQYNN